MASGLGFRVKGLNAGDFRFVEVLGLGQLGSVFCDVSGGQRSANEGAHVLLASAVMREAFLSVGRHDV